jgi:hypothetical protein
MFDVEFSVKYSGDYQSIRGFYEFPYDYDSCKDIINTRSSHQNSLYDYRIVRLDEVKDTEEAINADSGGDEKERCPWRYDVPPSQRTKNV